MKEKREKKRRKKVNIYDKKYKKERRGRDLIRDQSIHQFY